MSGIEVDGVLVHDVEKACGCYSAHSCEHTVALPRMVRLDLIGRDGVVASSEVERIDLDLETAALLGEAHERGVALAVTWLGPRPVTTPATEDRSVA